MQGIATALGLTYEEALMANFFYELSDVTETLPKEWRDAAMRSCTGIVHSRPTVPSTMDATRTTLHRSPLCSTTAPSLGEARWSSRELPLRVPLVWVALAWCLASGLENSMREMPTSRLSRSPLTVHLRDSLAFQCCCDRLVSTVATSS